MMGLTPKQRELLDVITERMAVDGVCPSYRELMAATGHASTSAISRLVGGLEERGYVRRSYNKARALEVLDTPRPILTAAPPRPLIGENTSVLVAEITARGGRVEWVA